MDDVLSVNNSSLVTLLTASIPLSLKDTDRSTSYLALHLEIDSEGRLRMNLYDKKRGFQLSIYMKQHSTFTCKWSIYLLVDPMLQSLWFLSRFPWYMLAANKETTESRVS